MKGRMHAGRMVQEMKDELSEAERTLLALKELPHRPNVRVRHRRDSETEESVTVHDAIKLLGR